MQELLIVVSCGSEVGIDGQTQRESSSLALLAAGVDPAAMVVNDEIASHQMDTVLHRAVGAHDERIEDQAQRFFWQAGAVITDVDLDFLLVGRGMIGKPGKCPLKTGSLGSTFFRVRIVLPSMLTTSSTSKNGGRCGISS